MSARICIQVTRSEADPGHVSAGRASGPDIGSELRHWLTVLSAGLSGLVETDVGLRDAAAGPPPGDVCIAVAWRHVPSSRSALTVTYIPGCSRSQRLAEELLTTFVTEFPALFARHLRRLEAAKATSVQGGTSVGVSAGAVAMVTLSLAAADAAPNLEPDIPLRAAAVLWRAAARFAGLRFHFSPAGVPATADAGLAVWSTPRNAGPVQRCEFPSAVWPAPAQRLVRTYLRLGALGCLGTELWGICVEWTLPTTGKLAPAATDPQTELPWVSDEVAADLPAGAPIAALKGEEAPRPVRGLRAFAAWLRRLVQRLAFWRWRPRKSRTGSRGCQGTSGP